MATLTAPSLNRLIKEARLLLNQPNASNSFWSDPELSVYLNDAVANYFTEIADRDEGQFTTVVNLDIVSGQEAVTLPDDCYNVRAVYKALSNGYQLIPYRNNITEDYSTQGGTGPETYSPYYYFIGNDIVLRPVPQFSQTAALRVEYIQFPETLIWGGDMLTAQFTPVFKELLVVYCAYKAKLKESAINGGNGHVVIGQHLAQLENTFKNNIGGRSKYPVFITPFNP